MAKKKNKIKTISIVFAVLIILIGIGFVVNNYILQEIVIFKPQTKPVQLIMPDIARQNTDTDLAVITDYLFDNNEVVNAVYLDDVELPACELGRITTFSARSESPVASYKCTISGNLLNTLGEHKIKLVFGNRYSAKAQCCLLAGQSVYNKLKLADNRLLDFKNVCLNDLQRENVCSKNSPLWADTPEGLLDVYGPAEFSPDTLFSTSISFKVIKEEEFDKILPTTTTTISTPSTTITQPYITTTTILGTTTTSLIVEPPKKEFNLSTFIYILLGIFVLIIVIIVTKIILKKK